MGNPKMANPVKSNDAHSHTVVDSVKDYDSPGQIFLVFFVVLIGLITTIGVSMAGLGDKALIIHMLISTVQVTFIGYFWMHMKKADQMTWLTMGSAFFIMLILFVLPLSDFLTRHRGGL